MDNENGTEEFSTTYKPLDRVEDSVLIDYCNPMVGDSVLDVCFDTLVGHAMEQLRRELENGGRITTNAYDRLRHFATTTDLHAIYNVPRGTLFITDIVAAAIRNLTAPVDAKLYFTAPSGYAYMACSQETDKWGECNGIKIIVRSNRTELKRDRRTREQRGFKNRTSVLEFIQSKWCQSCQDDFYEISERTDKTQTQNKEE